MDKTWFEQAIGDRTNLKAAFTRVKDVPPYRDLNKALAARFGVRRAAKIITSILRFVFYIQPVTRDVNTAKFAVRWQNTPNLFFDFHPNDSRWCSYQECVDISDRLCDEITVALNDAAKCETLVASIDNPQMPYDLPLDYSSAPFEDPPSRIHCNENISWRWENLTEQTFKLRGFIGQLEGEDGRALRSMLDKVAVKTYLTDRAQTGPYQTNREYRWEAHPLSVQFALRRECLAIEHTLMEQIFFFEGFPNQWKLNALAQHLIADRQKVTLCPITLKPLSFADFKREILTPDHGRSSFQVGHLNPLKTTSRLEHGAGHTAQNIAWISSDGNRIQGHLSLAGTHQLICDIAGRIANKTV